MSSNVKTAENTSLRTVGATRRFASLRVIMALVLREMSTTYGKSPGGYLWAVLEPVAAIAILTAVFSVGFRSPSIGINFPIFYATGIIPFFFFNDITNKLGSALNYSKSLLSYPSVTFVDAMFARFIINMVTQLMVAYIVFVGILAIFETQTAPDLPVILLSITMVATLAFSVGTFNCFMFTMFPVWQQVWSVITRPLFILSGTFFIYDSIPEPYAWYLWFNPLIHVIGTMRAGFYLNYDATYVSVAYVFGFSFVFLLTGLVFLRRYHRDLLNS